MRQPTCQRLRHPAYQCSVACCSLIVTAYALLSLSVSFSFSFSLTISVSRPYLDQDDPFLSFDDDQIHAIGQAHTAAFALFFYTAVSRACDAIICPSSAGCWPWRLQRRSSSLRQPVRHALRRSNVPRAVLAAVQVARVGVARCNAPVDVSRWHPSPLVLACRIQFVKTRI